MGTRKDRKSPGKRKAHTPEDRASALAALAANGGNLRLTSRQIGVSESTLRSWANGPQGEQARKDCAPKKGLLADYLDDLARHLAESIPASIEAASLQAKATAMGIVIDKAAILRQTIVPQEPEQPIDLSKLTPEQLETLNGWLQVADRPPGESKPNEARGDTPSDSPGLGTAVHGTLCGVDVAGVPVGVASPEALHVPGRPGGGEDTAADGVHAPSAREE